MELKVEISGPTGSGKTTLLRMITDFVVKNGYEYIDRNDQHHFVMVRRWPVPFPTKGGQ